MNHITVADMIRALSALPADARLVVTEDGYYSYGTCFTDAFLPRPVDGDGEDCSADEAVAYAIGHSSQNP